MHFWLVTHRGVPCLKCAPSWQATVIYNNISKKLRIAVKIYLPNNSLQWDNKITTLPGLYIASVLLLTPLRLISSFVTCNVWCLRMVNVAFSVLNLVLIKKILKKLHYSQDSKADKVGI